MNLLSVKALLIGYLTEESPPYPNFVSDGLAIFRCLVRFNVQAEKEYNPKIVSPQNVISL